MKKIVMIILFATTIIQLHSQSTSVYKKNTNHEKIELKLENDKIIYLKINGEVIDPQDYNSYQDLIKEINGSQPLPPSPPNIKHSSNSSITSDATEDNDELRNSFKSYLVKHHLIQPYENFKLYLNKEYLKVNKSKMSDTHRDQLIELYNSISGREFTDSTKIKMKEKNGNKSISIKEKGYFNIDKDMDF